MRPWCDLRTAVESEARLPATGLNLWHRFSLGVGREQRKAEFDTGVEERVGKLKEKLHVS